MQSTSLNNIALFCAALLSCLVWFGTLFLGFSFGFKDKQWLIFIIPIVLFFVTYIMMRKVLRWYVEDRIDVLYRTIDSLKKPTPNVFSLHTDPLAKASSEVSEWATLQTAEIAQLRKMEAYRRDFIGNISHELKTPIFNIQGYLETLLDGAIDDPSVSGRYLQRAADNAERLNLIVSDLNTIAQLESDALELEQTRFDLRLLLQEVMDDAIVLAVALDIKVKCERPKFIPLWVYADRERVRNVLNNLITNGIKYGTEGGWLKIQFFDVDNSRILVEISDNGMGIAPEHLPRLFERFYRTDTARSRAVGGTGLGLSIVKHIIEAHQQTIHVRSTENKGTTFGFTLRTSPT